jgi:hypothetical protein
MINKDEPGLGTIMIELLVWFKKRVCKILWSLEYLRHKMHQHETESDKRQEPKPLIEPDVIEPDVLRYSIIGNVPVKPGDYEPVEWNDAVQIIINSMRPVDHELTHKELEYAPDIGDISTDIYDILSNKFRTTNIIHIPLVTVYGIKFQLCVRPYQILKYDDKFIVIIHLEHAIPCYYQINTPLDDHITNTLIKNGCPVMSINNLTILNGESNIN